VKRSWRDRRDGRANIVVARTALIQESVAFHDLALAIVDEQHRFGVSQRAALRQKGHAANPHVLVMTSHADSAARCR